MRVLLADDHHLVRAGIHALVAALPGVTEVLQASDGHEALAAVATHRPDVVLMDITMPGLNGIDATAHIVKESPQTRVIILSVHKSEEFVWRALRAGARGYLAKVEVPEELQRALCAAERGEAYVSSSVRQFLGAEMGEGGGELPGELGGRQSPLERLSPRQREVLALIAEGMTNRAIARALGIHLKTVDTHRTELMRRLDIHDLAGLVRFAIRNGLISGE